MTLRDSLDLIKTVRPESGYTVLEHEILAERASSIANAERKVKDTIAAWQAETAEAGKAALLDEAKQAVWAYFVQRELMGFRRHNDVIQDLKIPPQVLDALGMVLAPTPLYRRPRR